MRSDVLERIVEVRSPPLGHRHRIQCAVREEDGQLSLVNWEEGQPVPMRAESLGNLSASILHAMRAFEANSPSPSASGVET